jgi:hypothetical protein
LDIPEQSIHSLPLCSSDDVQQSCNQPQLDENVDTLDRKPLF